MGVKKTELNSCEFSPVVMNYKFNNNAFVQDAKVVDPFKTMDRMESNNQITDLASNAENYESVNEEKLEVDQINRRNSQTANQQQLNRRRSSLMSEMAMKYNIVREHQTR